MDSPKPTIDREIVTACTVSVKQLLTPSNYTVSPQKTSTFYSLNNSVKNQLILMIFGKRNPEKI